MCYGCIKIHHVRDVNEFLVLSKTHLLRASDIYIQNVSAQCTVFELTLMHKTQMKCKMNETKRMKI